MIYNDLAIFVCVAKELSFTKAAERLGTPASRVSRRIRELEHQLETRLFERTTRQVRLTHEGQELLHQCEAPLESLRDTLSGGLPGKQESKGIIRVTAPSLAARTTIGPMILQFLRDHPGISIQLVTTNLYLDFIRDNIDIAFRFGPLKTGDVIAKRLWEVPYTLCASRDFILQHDLDNDISTERLAQLPSISTGQVWTFEEAPSFKMENVQHQIDDLTLARAAVEQGMGIGFLPEDMLTGRMQTLSVHGLTPKRRFMYGVYPSRRFLPKRVRDLLDWIINAKATDKSYHKLLA